MEQLRRTAQGATVTRQRRKWPTTVDGQHGRGQDIPPGRHHAQHLRRQAAPRCIRKPQVDPAQVRLRQRGQILWNRHAHMWRSRGQDMADHRATIKEPPRRVSKIAQIQTPRQVCTHHQLIQFGSGPVLRNARLGDTITELRGCCLPLGPRGGILRFCAGQARGGNAGFGLQIRRSDGEQQRTLRNLLPMNRVLHGDAPGLRAAQNRLVGQPHDTLHHGIMRYRHHE